MFTRDNDNNITKNKNGVSDNENKMDRRENNKTSFLFPKSILVLIVLIALLEVVFVGALSVAFCMGKISSGLFKSAVEASMLSDGIAIIGIAISVWAGLNIVNAIERKEMDDIKAKADSLDAEIENSFAEISENLEELNNQNANRNYMYRIAEKIELLNELSKTSQDCTTRQLMKLIKNCDIEESISIISLIEMERYFRIVFERHESKLNRDIELEKYVEKGISIANEILQITNSDVIKTYLWFRIADFNFYLGYCLTGEERINACLEALHYYDLATKGLGVNLPKYSVDEKYPNIHYEGCNESQKEISAYYCNTLGEAYSKIIEIQKAEKKKDSTKEISEEYASKAIFYCAYATYWGAREVYWRNLGCAIERSRIGVSDIFDKALNAYKNAMKVSCNVLTLKVYISLLEKKVNELLGIKSADANKGREIPLYNECYKNTYDMLEIDKKDELSYLLDEIYEYSRKAKIIFPKSDLGYTYCCIYYRDMCVISLDPYDYKKYFNKALDEYQFLELISPHGTLTKVLNHDLLDLKESL